LRVIDLQRARRLPRILTAPNSQNAQEPGRAQGCGLSHALLFPANSKPGHKPGFSCPPRRTARAPRGRPARSAESRPQEQHTRPRTRRGVQVCLWQCRLWALAERRRQFPARAASPRSGASQVCVWWVLSWACGEPASP